MNTELRWKGKNDSEKDVFEVSEQCSFWKNNGKCEKKWITKLVTMKARRNDLLSETN